MLRLYLFWTLVAIVTLSCTIYQDTAVIVPPTSQPEPSQAVLPTLSPVYPTTTPQPTHVVSCIIQTDYEPGNLNLRSCGGVDCDIITIIPESSLVDILEFSRDGWYLVRYQSQIGYVNAEYLDCEVR